MEKSKELTPMQELIEYIENKEYNYLNKESLDFANNIQDKAKSLLPKEKQGFEDSVNDTQKFLIGKENVNLGEKDVRVKMACCPECGNPSSVAVEHTMDKQSIKEFMKEVVKYNLDIKTIPLEEYRKSKIAMYCKDDCSLKTN